MSEDEWAQPMIYTGHDFNVEVSRHGGYVVYLPHQCDSWDIAGEGAEWGEGESRAEAIQHLEAFLADGAAALDALKAAPNDEPPATRSEP